MSEEYTQELRADSILYLIPATFIIIIALSVGVFVAHYEFIGRGVDAAFFLGNLLGSGFICYISYSLARDGRQQISGSSLVGLHLILLTINYYYLWQSASFIPYLYIYFIVISGTVMHPRASFYAWGSSVGLMIAVLILRSEVNAASFMWLSLAWFLGLSVAVGSYLAAVEWSLALEWANNIRLTVSQRRDELFQTQQELQRVNARQEFLYKQLTASVAVGQQITSILDLDKLLQEVADLITRQFGFDYVGLFLLSDDGQWLQVRAESGTAVDAAAPKPNLPLDAPHFLSQAVSQVSVMQLDDIHKETYKRHPYSWISVCSELVIPLRMKGGGALGALDIQNYHPHAFHKDNIPLLQSLADQVAIAARNADLYEREEMRRLLSERLYEIGRALSGTLDRQQVLKLILDNLAALLSFDRAAILLYRSELDVMEIVAARGFGEDVDPLGLQIATDDSDEDVFQQIYRTQEPLTIEDVSTHPGWRAVETIPTSRSWLGLPLIHRDEVVGMLSLVRFEIRAYTEQETTLATTFAAQAAIALQNARLYQRIARFNQELEQKVQERTEELSEAYSRLERLDKAKSDFIEVASHELRTPITVLRGYSDMLLTDTVIQQNEFHTQLAEGIRSGAIRMHEVVNDMLDVVKIDNENLRIYPAQISMQDVVKTAAIKLETAIAERRLNLTLLNLGEIPMIEADPELLHKLFMQLLLNAIKYTPDGGQITVSGKTAEYDNVSGVQITITDSGIGIDPNDHSLIFNKFYQTGKVALHSSGKTKFKGGGPGLGLAIARGIINAHQGRIWVESEGHDEVNYPGSQFHIFLPAVHQK